MLNNNNKTKTCDLQSTLSYFFFTTYECRNLSTSYLINSKCMYYISVYLSNRKFFAAKHVQIFFGIMLRRCSTCYVELVTLHGMQINSVKPVSNGKVL